jgi:hypothetical protein
MAGPLYSLSAPVYEGKQSEVALTYSHQQQIDLSRTSITALKQSLISYQKKSLSRVG